MVSLDEKSPPEVAVQAFILAAPRTTKTQRPPVRTNVYTNAGQTPGLVAGTVLVRYALPVPALGFDGFRYRAFLANLPPNVCTVLKAAKQAAGIR